MFKFIKKDGKSAEGARLSKKDLLLVLLAVIIVIFVLNYLSSRHFFRLDLTEGGQYTLSDSTKEILKNLDDVVNINIYFSKNLPPALTMIKRDVDDIMAEYRTYAGDKINVNYIDPQESLEHEQQVVLMGIPPVQLNVIAKDKAELVKLFLGIVVMHEDKKEVIPVVQNTANLEYDLTSAILKVASKETPKLKWFTKGEGLRFDDIKALLGRRYDVVSLTEEDFSLDPAKDALLILALEDDLTEEQLFAVDQYLMQGGKVFVMIDQVKVGSNLQVLGLEVGNVIQWLDHYKIDLKDKLLRDRSNSHAAFSGGYVTYHMPYAFWVKVGKEGFDQESPIVSDLDTLILPWVSPVEIGAEKPEGVEYTILAKSSSFNGVVGLDASLAPEGSQDFLNVPENEPKPLVVMASGEIPSYFGSGGRPAPVKDVQPIDVSKNGQIIVVGNTRFMQDNFLRQFMPNQLFFENAVDFMAMGEQLIGIRSKTVTDRPLERMSEAGIAGVKYFNLLFAPVLLTFLGIVLMIIRRQRRQVLKTVYK